MTEMTLMFLALLKPSLVGIRSRSGAPHSGASGLPRKSSVRIQCAPHVDTGRIIVEAFEGDIAGLEIRADPSKKHMQRHAAPLSDLAPAFNAYMPSQLRLLRKRAQFVDHLQELHYAYVEETNNPAYRMFLGA